MTLELRDIYRELLLVIAGFFKRQRDTFPVRSVALSANVLIYQTHAFQTFQRRYLDVIEKLIFSLVLILFCLEAEYSCLEGSPNSWEKYCMDVFQWEEECDIDTSLSELSEEKVILYLRSIQSLLGAKFLSSRYSPFLETSFGDCIDKIKAISYDLMQLTHSINGTIGDHASSGRQSMSKTKCLKRLCHKTHSSTVFKRTMDSFHQIRCEIRDEWLVSESSLIDNISDTIAFIDRRESELSEVNEDKPCLIDVSRMNPWADIRWQAGFYADLAMCLHCQAPTARRWFGGEVGLNVHHTRARTTIQGCGAIAELLNTKHCYFTIYQKACAISNEDYRPTSPSTIGLITTPEDAAHFMKEILNEIDNCLYLSIQAICPLRRANQPRTLLGELNQSYAHCVLTHYLYHVKQYIQWKVCCGRIVVEGVYEEDDFDEDDYWDTQNEELQFWKEHYRLSRGQVNQHAYELAYFIPLVIHTTFTLGMNNQKVRSTTTVLSQNAYDYAVLGHYTENRKYLIDNHSLQSFLQVKQHLFILRIKRGIHLLNQEANVGVKYYSPAFYRPDTSIKDLSRYLLKLSEMGRTHLNDALELVESITLKNDLAVNQVILSALDIQLYMQHLMASVYRELIRSLRYIITLQFQFELSIDLKLLFKNVETLVNDVQQMYGNSFTIARNEADLQQHQLAHNDHRYMILKCKVLHTIIGIRSLVLLLDEVGINEMIEHEYPFRCLDIPQEVCRLFDDNPLDTFDSAMANNVEHLQSLANSHPSLHKAIGDMLFWSEQVLICIVLDMESVDFLVGSFDRVDNTFPLHHNEHDVHNNIFKETELRLIERCKDSIAVLMVQQSIDGKDSTSTIDVMPLTPTVPTDDNNEEQNRAIMDIAQLAARIKQLASASFGRIQDF